MLLIQDILISDDVVEDQFMCNLSACKGACCWEGDFGAPLEKAELEVLSSIYEQVAPYLSPEGREAIAEQGHYTYYEDNDSFGTPLIDSGPCAYMVYDEQGIAKCGIEQAYLAGKTDFKKPVSCHLYPIRVLGKRKDGFEALNYDRWDICSAACELGRENQMPVYQFVKDAIIRKYGQGFYEELDAAAKHLGQAL
ncbi:MAG: DUF3109 family protein [Phaeodactylibacter sp.]|nr:DUF3109 family protein [Phaeodactylibacter sp.]MCB9301922.1 DUF3109 family protein [Lewinellaceae bacterium]HQU58285.1 DUF3109 family protein [Saprospiraceae bacterium]